MNFAEVNLFQFVETLDGTFDVYLFWDYLLSTDAYVFCLYNSSLDISIIDEFKHKSICVGIN